MFATASEMKFEMLSEMKTEMHRAAGVEKELRKCKLV